MSFIVWGVFVFFVKIIINGKNKKVFICGGVE
jgi:hypothetical protein